MHHLHVCVEFTYAWLNDSRMKDLALWLYQRMIPRDWYNSSLQANWLTRFNPHSNTPLQRAGAFALLFQYIYTLVLLLLLLLAVHPWLLGINHLYLYVVEKSIHIVDRCFVGRRLYVHFDTVATAMMIFTLGGSIMVTRSLFHFCSLTSDRFVLTKFSSLRFLLVSSWLGNPWSAEAPGSDHCHFFCCTTL